MEGIGRSPEEALMTPEEREQLLHDIEMIEFPEGVPAGVDAHEVRGFLERIAQGRSAKPEPNTYYEWSIKRLERRVRLLTAAIALLILAAAVVVALVLLRAPNEAPAGTVSPGGRPDDEELSGIRGDLDAIQNKLDERDAAITRLRSELKDTRRCAARGVHQLEQRVRQLVKGAVGPNEWVRAPAISACAVPKR